MKFIRKTTAILAVILLSSSLAACSQSQPDPQPSPSPSPVVSQESTMTIVISASLFEGKSLKEVQEAAKEQGVESVTQNEDGDYCYEMTATAHRRLVTEMRMNLLESVEELPDEETYPSVKSVVLSDDLSTLTVTVDAAAYKKSNDQTIVRAVWPSLSAYYLFNNESPDDKTLSVVVIDEEDESKVDSFTWPEKKSSDESSTTSEATSEAASEDA